MASKKKYCKTYTASGGAGINTTVYSGQIKFFGILLGLDGTNSQTVTVHDNTSASGDEAIPTQTISGTEEVWNGVMPGMDEGLDMQNGIHLVVTGSGSVDVSLYTNNPNL